MNRESEYVRPLAELAVRFGANVQPGQIVSISSEPGKEPLARAIAEVAYEQGAKFVDLSVFDAHVKRARLKHAAPETLEYVPPWYANRILGLGEHRAATIALTGRVAPRLMDDIDPARLGRDRLPSVKESMAIMNERRVNWTAIPCPTLDWAELVYPETAREEALGRYGAISLTSAGWTNQIRPRPGGHGSSSWMRSRPGSPRFSSMRCGTKDAGPTYSLACYPAAPGTRDR